MSAKYFNIISQGTFFTQILSPGTLPETTYFQMGIGGQIHVIFVVFEMKNLITTDTKTYISQTNVRNLKAFVEFGLRPERIKLEIIQI